MEKSKMTQKCAICGCTDDDCSKCVAVQGIPCHWAAENICSRCEDFGKVAYDAYCDTVGWKSAITGSALPQFANSSPAVRIGWMKAAAAVVNELCQ